METKRKVEPDDLNIIHNVDLEIKILGCLIMAPDLISLYAWLPKEAFWTDEHRKIWGAMVEVYRSGQIPAMTPLVMALHDRGAWSLQEAQSKIARIVDESMAFQPDPDFIGPYFNLLVEIYRKRRLDEFSYQMRARIRVPNSNWKSELQNEFSDIFQDGESTESEFVNMADFVDDETDPSAISTGLAELDQMLNGGIKRQELTVIAARASMGKSALMVWLSQAAAFQQQNTFMFSAEMPTRKVRQRWLSALSGFPYSCWRNVPDYKRQEAEQAFTQISKFLYCNDLSSKPDRILASLNREFLRHKVDLVFIDHLHQVITGSDNKDADEASYFATELRQLAKKHNAAVVLLAQVNRGVEGRQDKRPQKSDIRQFGSIEQIADLMMMMYRDEYYNPDSHEKNVTEILVVKNRDGATGTVKVLSDMALNRYYDMTPDNQGFLSRRNQF
mgnify:CR=1 FL=1